MPTQVTYLLEESHKSYDILVYSNRPQILSQLKYTELFKYYTCKKDIPSAYSRNANLYANNTLKLQFEVYLSLFGREEVVVCMGMVCLTAFERLL